ncbi:hypothetical protein RJ639_031871, partial [Escallonia herrerae]
LEETPGTTENSAADLIAALKYIKDADLIGDDNVCAICLCEFEEGEELRTLPECAHTFHVPCKYAVFHNFNKFTIKKQEKKLHNALIVAQITRQLNSSIAKVSPMAYYDHHPILTEIYVLIVGVASTALLVSIFHCIRIKWLNRQWHASEQLRQTTVLEQGDTPSGFENSMVELMPARKYQKGMGLVGEEGVCPVCLSEFEDGEELRTLPECMHSYHVPCIDMWLLSHPNCPVCRANATPSIATRIVIDSDSGPG